MAEVLPIHAVRFDPERAGPLEDLVAPPYDVITAEGRAALLARSPNNIVALDLPETGDGSDIYAHAARLLERRLAEGVLVAEREPSIWAYEQQYTGPDQAPRTRRGFLARFRIEEYGAGRVRPHERTQPRPKEDRLRLTRACAHNLSPIFVLHPGTVWELLTPALGEPFGEASDDDATTHRVWRIADPAVHRAISERLADAEFLIADGHHRYETARAYAAEIGGEGPHNYVLACFVSLDDPGLTVFATNRLLTGLSDQPDKQAAIRDTTRRHFTIEEVASEAIVPPADAGPGAFGYIDAHHQAAYHLRLNDPSILETLLGDHSEAYRNIDAAILETIFLRGALGMSSDDIAAKRGVAYDSDLDSALARVSSGAVDAGFFLRPTPIEQVRAVAASGETMPPKSTYFFPKILTGIVLNPLR